MVLSGQLPLLGAAIGFFFFFFFFFFPPLPPPPPQAPFQSISWATGRKKGEGVPEEPSRLLLLRMMMMMGMMMMMVRSQAQLKASHALN